MEKQVLERASKKKLKWLLDSPNPTVRRQAKKELDYRKVYGRKGRQFSKAQKRKLDQELTNVGNYFATRHVPTPSEATLEAWLVNANIPYIKEHVIVRTSNRLRQEEALKGQRIFIADFFLPEVKLIIEVDGGYHSTPEQRTKDYNRDVYLRNAGYPSLRVTNEQLEQADSLDSLYQILLQGCKTPTPKKRLAMAFGVIPKEEIKERKTRTKARYHVNTVLAEICRDLNIPHPYPSKSVVRSRVITLGHTLESYYEKCTGTKLCKHKKGYYVPAVDLEGE